MGETGFTIPGVFAVDAVSIAPGDVLTFANIYERNPAWRWWKFWLPKTLPALRKFTVLS